MIDIKAKLQQFVPSLFELLGDNDINWTTINKKFGQKLKQREAVLIEDKTDEFAVEACFFDIISAALIGNKSAHRLFSFFDKLLQELAIYVSSSQKKQLKATIYSLLTNFDKCYLNFIGELAVLNQLLKSGNYKLERIAYPLSNGKDIDFLLLNIKKEVPLLLEVVNIHLSRIFVHPQEVIDFLTNKMQEKLESKGVNLTHSEHFLLATVLWGSADELQKIAEVFKQGFKIKLENVLEPLAYASYYNEHCTYSYFGTISTLFSKKY